MPEKISQEQIAEVTTHADGECGMQIPEHAILRLARFLLPKMRKDLEKDEELPTDGSRS